MHPYLPHLLSDITAACRTEIPLVEKRPISFEEEMEEIERWVEGEDPPHTFGYYCGLETIDFPPAEQLTNKEMKQINTAFGQMMFSWNLGIDLPDTLPVPMAYKMTVDTLDMKTGIVNSGMVSFDFCSGYAPDCVFKEHCPCLAIWNANNDEDCSL
jgi:hypothetical protein